MTKVPVRQIELRREEVVQLLDELRKESERYQKRLELDARLLGSLHTFFGHSRPSANPSIVTGAFRRTQDLLRGL